jgi:predicted HAD superfamily Cof-like phosphohydrolase
MSDEIESLQARVKALEWALHHLLLVLTAEPDTSPLTELPQSLHTAADRAAVHNALSERECQALIQLADDLAGIPAEYPAYLKQVRRDWPT